MNMRLHTRNTASSDRIAGQYAWSSPEPIASHFITIDGDVFRVRSVVLIAIVMAFAMMLDVCVAAESGAEKALPAGFVLSSDPGHIALSISRELYRQHQEDSSDLNAEVWKKFVLCESPEPPMVSVVTQRTEVLANGREVQMPEVEMQIVVTSLDAFSLNSARTTSEIQAEIDRVSADIRLESLMGSFVVSTSSLASDPEWPMNRHIDLAAGSQPSLLTVDDIVDLLMRNDIVVPQKESDGYQGQGRGDGELDMRECVDENGISLRALTLTYLQNGFSEGAFHVRPSQEGPGCVVRALVAPADYSELIDQDDVARNNQPVMPTRSRAD
jgi:hypothetical protein